MTCFISGHRDLTEEEFNKFYAPAIEEAIDAASESYDVCEFVVGDCKGCDEMAARFIAKYIEDNTEDPSDYVPCSLTIYHMFSEPRFRIGTECNGSYYIDMVDWLNEDRCDDDEPWTLPECPQIYYCGGYESDTERDAAMTRVSDQDIAFLRNKSKWDSGTAENLLRRHTMKFIHPSHGLE